MDWALALSEVSLTVSAGALVANASRSSRAIEKSFFKTYSSVSERGAAR